MMHGQANIKVKLYLFLLLVMPMIFFIRGHLRLEKKTPAHSESCKCALMMAGLVYVALSAN